MSGAALESFHSVGLNGVGMATSLGQDCATSCASARAGISRIREFSEGEFRGDAAFSDPSPRGHTAACITPGLRGAVRLQALGIAALKDLAAQTGEMPRGAAFFLLLPDRFLLEGMRSAGQEDGDANVKAAAGPSANSGHPFADRLPWREECASLAPRILAGAGMAISPDRCFTAFGGAAEASRLVSEAAAWIRAGKSRCCIVGGIDSFLDPGFFAACSESGWWSAPENTLLKWPGEGACFLRLEPQGLSIAEAGCVSIAASAWLRCEERRFSGKPATGKDMSAALLRAFGSAPEGTPSSEWLLTNLCGDAFFASDFGKAIVRVQARHPLADLPWAYPAGSFGDCGAAMGFMCAGVFREAVRRGYAPSAQALIGLYSDNGAVGAMRLKASGYGGADG